jgi:hypothetical protein
MQTAIGPVRTVDNHLPRSDGLLSRNRREVSCELHVSARPTVHPYIISLNKNIADVR